MSSRFVWDSASELDVQTPTTSKIMQHWSKGEGAAKIKWGTPGDMDRCVAELSKHASPAVAKGLCSRLQKRV